VLVGDTRFDVQCAKGAGVGAVAVLWGIGTPHRCARRAPMRWSRMAVDLRRTLFAWDAR